MTMKIALTAIALGLAVTAAHAETQITGAGSSFAAPIYGKWGEAGASATGMKLNYQAVGSGAGINRSTTAPSTSAHPICRSSRPIWRRTSCCSSPR